MVSISSARVSRTRSSAMKKKMKLPPSVAADSISSTPAMFSHVAPSRVIAPPDSTCVALIVSTRASAPARFHSAAQRERAQNTIRKAEEENHPPPSNYPMQPRVQARRRLRGGDRDADGDDDGEGA
eukprot:1918898-Rhodomonas_salina.1